MSSVSPFQVLRDPRLAALALSPAPAWLWRPNGEQVLWANAAGVVALGAGTLGELTEWQFAANEPAAVEVVRLAGMLDPAGATRVERLRGFGDRLSGMSVCACSYITLADTTPAILIAATLQMRRAMGLTERIRVMFDGGDDALAAFGADGMLLYANGAGEARLAKARSIGALGALGALGAADKALRSGASQGEVSGEPVEILRLGSSPEVILLMRFGAPLPQAVAPSAPADVVRTGQSTDVAASQSPQVPSPEPPAPPPPAPQAPAPATPSAGTQAATGSERRHPLRFVWQIDAEGRFSINSDEFIALAGESTARLIGCPFEEFNERLAIDPDHLIARALATRDTWSGITLNWPVDAGTEPLKVEMSGLPIYDRERRYAGYRGFGVCRNIDGLAALARARREGKRNTAECAEATRQAAPAAIRAAAKDAPAPAARKVVPFRAISPSGETKVTELSPGERTVFSEIAQRLSARLKDGAQTQAPAGANVAAAQPAVLRTVAGPGIDGRKTGTEATADSNASAIALPDWLSPDADGRALLDHLPVGVLIYWLETPVYANPAFLQSIGCADLQALSERGGLDSLYVELAPGPPDAVGGRALTIKTGPNAELRRDGRMFSVQWQDASADVLVLAGPPAPSAPAAQKRDAPSRTAPETPERDTGTRRAEATATERANLLAMISYEVRTPLTTIVGFAETMLDEKYGPIGNERYRKYLDDIRASAEGILALFDNVVSLATIAPREYHGAQTADINAIAQECVGLKQVDASRARVLIRTALGTSLPRAAIAPDAARQIVQVLLSNSIKFAGAGSQVIVSTATASGKVILRLRDTGAGLNAAELAAALQAPDAGTQPSSGSLSFAVARALAEASGATIAISSKRDEGTLVEIAFPFAAAD
jgi:signal transduction histidine kinase